MRENEFRKILEKFIQGNVSDKEKKHLQYFEDQLIRRNSESAFLKPGDQQRIKQDILNAINKNIHRPSYLWLKIAAIVIIIFGSASFFLLELPVSFYQDHSIEVVSGDAPRYHILPDSSSIWLNHDSGIKYSPDFKNNRTLSLTGEAFFVVKKDKDHPFSVSFNKHKLLVTGTQFNIDASNSQIQEVAVKEGSVKVATSASQEFDLRKDDFLKVSKEKAQQVRRSFPEKGYWKAGALIFNKVALDQALHLVCQRYGLTLKADTANREQFKDRITIRFEENLSVFDVINGLEIITPYNYEVNLDKLELKVNQK